MNVVIPYATNTLKVKTYVDILAITASVATNMTMAYFVIIADKKQKERTRSEMGGFFLRAGLSGRPGSIGAKWVRA